MELVSPRSSVFPPPSHLDSAWAWAGRGGGDSSCSIIVVWLVSSCFSSLFVQHLPRPRSSLKGNWQADKTSLPPSLIPFLSLVAINTHPHAYRQKGEPGKSRDFLPPDKQYLVTRNGECSVDLAVSHVRAHVLVPPPSSRNHLGQS